MTDQLREYHDALVRIDALVLQLRSALVVARTGWYLEDDETLPDTIEAIGDIASRMDEVIPDAVKATRLGPGAAAGAGDGTCIETDG